MSLSGTDITAVLGGLGGVIVAVTAFVKVWRSGKSTPEAEAELSWLRKLVSTLRRNIFTLSDAMATRGLDLPPLEDDPERPPKPKDSAP
jgi:hypothetical protein